MKKFLIIISILIFTLSCSTTEELYTHETFGIEKSDMSVIMKNKKIGRTSISDAILQGQIIDKETKTLLSSVNVFLSDTNSYKNYGYSTDSLGRFSIQAPAGNYIFDIYYGGYYGIKQILEIKTGEIREMKILLGQTKDYKYLYDHKNNGTIIE